MSSRRSSSEATTYRDSPLSPSSPISPTSLPRWFRPGRSRSNILAHSRVRLTLVAAACILLGWLVTSSLGPSEEFVDLDGGVEVYDAASGGTLGDPAGYGQPLIETVADDDDEDFDAEPSVKGALADLHHAVTDKIQEWNPYYKPDKTTPKNKTAAHKGQKAANTSVPIPIGEYVADGIPDSENLGARTRVGKVTILFNGNGFWERAIRTHEQHDRMQGYRLHVLRQQLLDDVWSKPAYILSLLLRELAKPESERLEWLFWVDADTIILNPHIPIEVFLPPAGPEYDDIHLLYSNDWNGLNNGVFPVRVNRWSVELFSAIVAFRYYRPDSELVFRDQSAMNNIMNEPKFKKNIVQAPQRWFNAYQGEHNETLAPFQIRRGDLLVHFAGVGNREERMGYWLDRAEQHLDDWEVPLKSTSYPQERRDFWSEWSGNRKNFATNVAQTRLKASEMMAQVTGQLMDYGDRLTEAEKEVIAKANEELQKVLSDEKYSEDIEKISGQTEILQNSALPLTSSIKDAQKLLLDAAHVAIFAGEKDVLENKGGAPELTVLINSVSNAVQNLKSLVMAPQEQWHKPTIAAATNSVTEARGQLQEKLAAQKAEVAEVAVQEDTKKALEEQVAKEAGGEVVAGPARGVADLLLGAPTAAVVVTSQMPATTVMQVQTVIGEAVVATVIGEPVVHTITQEPVAVTLWTTIQDAVETAAPAELGMPS